MGQKRVIMRTVFIVIGTISVALLIFNILILLKKSSRLNDVLIRMLVYAAIGVTANVVIAATDNWTVNNLSFAIYFASIDLITYYLLVFSLIYTGRHRFKNFITKIYRYIIVLDAADLMLNIYSEKLFTMYAMELSDGSIAYQTVPMPLFNVHLFLCYLPIVVGMGAVFISTLKSHSFYKAKYFTIFSIIIIIVILNVFYMTLSLPFDWSVLLYGVAGFLLFYFSNYYIPRRLMNNTLRLAVDSMKEGLFLYDAERNCIYINKTARETFGITSTEITARDYPLNVWLEGKDREARSEFVETFTMDLDGTPHNIRVDFRYCLSKRRRTLGSFFLFEDITEDVQMMKNLEDARAEANRANVAKSLFLANMSHEIRTPINSILGMNEMILRESTNPTVVEYAEDIESSGHTLLSLINNILDFSKIESGKMEIKPEPYSVHTLIRDCHALVAPRAQQKDLPLRIECDENVPKELIGDMARIRQVLVNLLTNSIKYTKYGHVGLKLIWEGKNSETGNLKFIVSDTGQGISETDMSRLFKVFQRVDEEQNRNIEGTGLGLAISQELMNMMDGTISVSSSKGIGSEFTVMLPQKLSDPEPAGKFAISEKPEKKRVKYTESFHAPDAKVLVVDDIELNLKLIGALLKKTRINMVMADGGNKAIELCKTEDFDLILMDHMMPPPDGVEAMKRIKEAGGHNAGIPFIVLTANAIEGADKTYLDLGFDGYLSKPVISADLEEALKSFLPAEKIKD